MASAMLLAADEAGGPRTEVESIVDASAGTQLTLEHLISGNDERRAVGYVRA